MKVILVALVLVLLLAVCQAEHDYAALFEQWSQKYQKMYTSEEEAQRRSKIFAQNYDLIESHNQDSTKTYTLECNEFCDGTWEEFKRDYLDTVTAPQLCSATAMRTRQNKQQQALRADLPDRIDWREKNVITPVKNQRKCGSCWTFSTTGCLESHYAIKTGVLVSLSEQQLVDCAGDFDNHGCQGGLPSHAFEYIRYAGGLQGEASYPYQAQNMNCTFNPSLVIAKTLGSVNITEGDEEGIHQTLGSIGPVSIAFQVVADIRFYKSGVYSSTDCKSSAETVNHAVLAVGYDTTPDNIPYFIVKNSWSVSWGAAGYFNIIRGHNMCGIATCASYPQLP